ncbi:MAG: DUF4272 domain-containing protein [Acidobacteriota bacterium]
MRDADSDELTPPTAERVQRRALALSAMVCRGFLEQDAGAQEAEAFRGRLLDWLRQHGVADELEPSELAFLDAELGSADPQAVVNATWRAEGVGVLAWALGRFELTPHDVPLDPKAAADAVGFLAEAIEPEPRLRASDELTTQSEILFATHWRIRDHSLNRGSLDFAEFARTCWFGPLVITGLPLAEGDLAVGGRSIAKAEPQQVGFCLSMALERHQAIRWVLGWSELYSEIDTST